MQDDQLAFQKMPLEYPLDNTNAATKAKLSAHKGKGSIDAGSQETKEFINAVTQYKHDIENKVDLKDDKANKDVPETKLSSSMTSGMPLMMCKSGSRDLLKQSRMGRSSTRGPK